MAGLNTFARGYGDSATPEPATGSVSGSASGGRWPQGWCEDGSRKGYVARYPACADHLRIKKATQGRHSGRACAVCTAPARMLAIVAGGIVLTVQRDTQTQFPWAALAIAAACLCWAIDNNLTRTVSGGDPVQVAAIKGACAGTINTGIALCLGYHVPDLAHVAAAAVLGLVGYGVSLVMFVIALRHLGTARTGAYFSTAPFVGAALSLALLRETPNIAFDIAGLLMRARF